MHWRCASHRCLPKMLSAAVLHCLPFTGLCTCAFCSEVCWKLRAHILASCTLCAQIAACMHVCAVLCVHAACMCTNSCAQLQSAASVCTCARAHRFCLHAAQARSRARAHTHTRMRATKPACCTRNLMHCAQHTESGRCV